jgi:deaminated glutathione amidase
VFPIAVAQLNSTDNFESNLTQILDLISAAAKTHPRPKIVFFPENSLYLKVSNLDKVQAVKLLDSCIQKIDSFVKQVEICVHLTTATEQLNKMFNSSLLFTPGEAPRIVYNKVHLFDVFIPEQEPMIESAVFSPGEEPQIFSVEKIRFGSSICYDVRFSELYSAYAKENVQAVVVPAAFLVKTGQAHWMTLLKARAIESQCFVIAPAQGGRHLSSKYPGEFRETYGHSVVFDPWGTQLALKESGVGLIFAELDLNFWEQVRKSIPMSNHRRL